MKRRVLLWGLLLVTMAPVAHAEVDWSLDFAMPVDDLAVGIGGGVAVGEEAQPGDLGGLMCASVSWLDGALGLHGTVYGHRERRANRVGGALEATVWYVLLMGAGVSHGVMDAPGGDTVPRASTAFTLFAGVPWPMMRLADGGALVVMAWARPGLRFEDRSSVSLHTQAGLSLLWSTYSF